MSAADVIRADEVFSGRVPPPRHVDITTAGLDHLARTWLDFQQSRLIAAQRELPDEIVGEFARLEQLLSERLKRTLRRHSIWPWLSQFPGLGGAHTALVIGRIGDPRRFPGQRCSEGHYLPPVYAVGAPCPIVASSHVIEGLAGDGASVGALTTDEVIATDDLSGCQGVMLSPRTTTGVRSLHRFAGLDADADGHAPRMRKGMRCHWDPRVRASVMQPGGIAEQIVRLNVPHYSDIYRVTKARLILRVADISSESENGPGGANLSERNAELSHVSEGLPGRPLRLFQADRIARKIAAKAFLGDLLIEWKRVAA